MPRRKIIKSEDEVGSEAKTIQKKKSVMVQKQFMSMVGDKLPCDIIPHYKEQNVYKGRYMWYLLVFKPLNSNYDPAYNALDWIRIKFARLAECYVITKETLAEKIHWNLLIYTNDDMTGYHELRSPRYMIYSQEVTKSPLNVYQYITKEYYENGLLWEIYIDFNYYIKIKSNIILDGDEEDENEETETL